MTESVVDKHYSAAEIAAWKAVLGEDLHYHAGFYDRPNCDFLTAQRNAVRMLYPYIPDGSRVLDLGCGWGGPARMLMEEKHCNVTGLTVSSGQHGYLRTIGVPCILHDLETGLPEPVSGRWDLVMMLESLSHIRNKLALLRQAREVSDRLVLRVNCVRVQSEKPDPVFGGTMWMPTRTELVALLAASGWHPARLSNIRRQGAPTVLDWRSRILRAYPEIAAAPEPIRVLHDMCRNAVLNLPQWIRDFPLIEIVAD